MLLELRISNFALAEEVAIGLGEGLAMVTGETGAGKSLVAGALAVLGGGAADREQIRKGEELAIVEGVFDLSGRDDLAAEVARLGIRLADDRILVLRRELRREGRSRVVINGLISSLAVLERLGPLLIAVQSQDQARELAASGYARDLLDDLLELGELRDGVAATLAALREASAELARREHEAAAAREQLDLWRYQHDELRAAHLVAGEEAELGEQIALKQNARALQEAAARALARLTEGPAAARDGLGAAESALAAHADKSPRLHGALENLTAAGDLVGEAASELERFLDALDLDPRGLDELQARKALYEDLRRKYRRDVDGLVELRDDLAARLARQASETQDLADLAARRDEAVARLEAACLALRRARQAGAPDVARQAQALIRPLALPDLELTFAIEPLAAPASHGADEVALLVRTNPGEGRGPVARIASGGERSRIHLGLTVLRQDRSGRPPLVRLYDEIDAGLGMDAAPPVARLLRRLAQTGQVLCITHLATMAVAGEDHLRVAKRVRDGRTSLVVEALAGEERVAEVVRLLGGDAADREDPETRRAYARQLIGAGGAP